jgi:choline/glycine/proline betaine transport protein
MTNGPTFESRGVFWVSAVLIVLFVATGIAFPARMESAFGTLLEQISTQLGWFYILVVASLLVVSVWLGVGRFGHVRLGADDERPEFSTPTWFAMLFSAGMGIGLVFYGVAEPIIHYSSPPSAVPDTDAAAQQAMVITFFHWGLHAWGIYVITSAALAYFAFRRGLPLSIRSALHPLIGERIHGPIGQFVDVLAVFGTLFGLATSLGLGGMQVNAGLAALFGLEVGTTQQVVIIALITAMATVSVVTGLRAGVRRLSELNMTLATLLLAFVFVVGPTVFLLDAFADNLGHYLRSLVYRTFYRDAWREGGEQWHASWTLFYWGWWISWAPFVGTFIARISRGRTLREFVLGVMAVPTLLTFGWFTVFGDTALWLEREGYAIAEAVERDTSTAIFAMLSHLPLASISSFVAVVVVILFFVTSSDSGSFVVDMITSGGDPDPPVGRRVFWAVTEGVVAATLLLAGGLKALQSAAICTGLPFAIVLILSAFGLIKALRHHEGASPPPPTDDE